MAVHQRHASNLRHGHYDVSLCQETSMQII